jgi:hypothetical protein
MMTDDTRRRPEQPIEPTPNVMFGFVLVSAACPGTFARPKDESHRILKTSWAPPGRDWRPDATDLNARVRAATTAGS